MSRDTLYARPRTLSQLTELLGSLEAGASLIAGGQELMPTLNYGVFAPSVLIDINKLAELAGIREEADSISIGALSTHRMVENHELVLAHAPLLSAAISCIGGGWQVKNRGTIGGNIVSMHSLYDAVPALLALHAAVEICSGEGARSQKLQEVLGDTKHGLGSSSVLTRVCVPKSSRRGGWGYAKLKGTHGAYASAIGAATVEFNEAGGLAAMTVVTAATESLPRLLDGSLGKFLGQRPSEPLFAELQRICSLAIKAPLSDQRGDADYRRAMAGLYARKAFAAACDMAARANHQQEN